MSPQTITALTSLVVGIATLVTAITAVIKAIEAKNTAQTVAVQQQVNHAETTKSLGLVEAQTNGIVLSLPAAITGNVAKLDEINRKSDAMAIAVAQGLQPPASSAPLPVTVASPTPLPVVVANEKGGTP